MLFPILDIAIHSLIAIRSTQTYFLETRGCDVMVFLTDLNYGISQKISLIDAKSLGIDEITIWIYFIKDTNWQIYSDSQNIINALPDLVNIKRKNYDIDRCCFYTNLWYQGISLYMTPPPPLSSNLTKTRGGGHTLFLDPKIGHSNQKTVKTMLIFDDLWICVSRVWNLKIISFTKIPDLKIFRI